MLKDLASISLKQPVRIFVNCNTDVAPYLRQEFVRIRPARKGDREAVVAVLGVEIQNIQLKSTNSWVNMLQGLGRRATPNGSGIVPETFFSGATQWLIWKQKQQLCLLIPVLQMILVPIMNLFSPTDISDLQSSNELTLMGCNDDIKTGKPAKKSVFDKELTNISKKALKQYRAGPSFEDKKRLGIPTNKKRGRFKSKAKFRRK
ncbi:hypothetical protein J4Q44_G00108910 [Coregonus suidteri]|uniref:Uncharacterized protein n=1 Tax=Coregonus suidteri TaxID=861788 RepID=A0AAN8LW10_9TELE